MTPGPRPYERLGTGPLRHRYAEAEGLPPGDGAFGIAGFWGVEARARDGDRRGHGRFRAACYQLG